MENMKNYWEYDWEYGTSKWKTIENIPNYTPYFKNMENYWKIKEKLKQKFDSLILFKR